MYHIAFLLALWTNLVWVVVQMSESSRCGQWWLPRAQLQVMLRPCFITRTSSEASAFLWRKSADWSLCWKLRSSGRCIILYEANDADNIRELVKINDVWLYSPSFDRSFTWIVQMVMSKEDDSRHRPALKLASVILSICVMPLHSGSD